MELVCVLAASLRASGAQHPLLVLVLPMRVRPSGVESLRSAGAVPLVVRPLPLTPNIRLDQPHWLYAFSKLRAWEQTEYSRLVYIDGDSVVLHNPDYLFALPLHSHGLAAARDVHACNQSAAVLHMMSSLMVLTPSRATYDGLISLMPRNAWRNGDQQLIRRYFDTHGGVQLLSESDAAFVHRCRCLDYNATAPAILHFTTAFAPTWDAASQGARAREMERHGWCRTRAAHVSCTRCADATFERWIELRRGMNISAEE